MKKKLSVMLLILVLLTALCAAASASLYYTTGSGVRVRTGPGTGYTILANLPLGTKLDVESISHGWAYVTLWSGSDPGYVSAKYISQTKPTSSSSKSTTTTSTASTGYRNFKTTSYNVIVNPKTNYANMHWEANKSSQVRRVYFYGSPLKVVAENGTWCQVADETTGEIGFMLKSLLLRTAE